MLLGELFQKIDERKLVLPNFQRDLEWKKNQQKDLVASVLLGLPIGSILLLEGKSDDFSSKRIGYSTMIETPAEECLYLLDGQQRITSLKSSFCDFYDNENWLNIMDEVYPILKNRLFLRVNAEEDEEDIFGYERLVFNEEIFRKQDPIVFENRLIHESIGKTLTNKWCNPGVVFKELTFKANETEERKQKRVNNQFCKECANRYLIPLYCLNQHAGTKKIKNVLNNIANKKLGDLKAEADGDTDLIVKYLEPVNPDIQEDINEIDENELNSLWQQLASTWVADLSTYLEKILSLDIPIIQLKSDEIGRAVIIFENINRGGTKLSNFDLVVARAARDKEYNSLSLRIKDTLESPLPLPKSLTNRILMTSLRPTELNISNMTVKDGKVNESLKNQYLNVLSIYCKELDYNLDFQTELAFHKTDIISRQRILSLTHHEINNYTDLVLTGIKRACAFLNIRCGVSRIEELQYKLMLVPLANTLIDDNVWNNEACLNKLEAWYWISIFSGLYARNQNERCLKDVNQIRYYLYTDTSIYSEYMNAIFQVPGYCDQELLLNQSDQSIPTTVHKVLLQYLLSTCPPDFMDNITLTAWQITNGEIKVDDHHIRPLKNATSLGQSSSQLRKNPKHPLNSSLNRTYILSQTNNKISDKAPEQYFKEISRLNLSEHLIEEGDYQHQNSFDSDDQMYSFELNNRYKRLLDKIKGEINSLLN